MSAANGNGWKSKNYSGLGPRGYRRSDESIKEEICEILVWNPLVDASEIRVDVAEGVVTLAGEVDSRHSKQITERAIEEVRGVKDVCNLLEVGPQFNISKNRLLDV